MNSTEIALELTKAAIEQGLVKRPEGVVTDKQNVAVAEEIAQMFNIIYKSIDETLAGE